MSWRSGELVLTRDTFQLPDKPFVQFPDMREDQGQISVWEAVGEFCNQHSNNYFVYKVHPAKLGWLVLCWYYCLQMKLLLELPLLGCLMTGNDGGNLNRPQFEKLDINLTRRWWWVISCRSKDVMKDWTGLEIMMMLMLIALVFVL